VISILAGAPEGGDARPLLATPMVIGAAGVVPW
jgi:hypothetical protein